MQAILIPVKRPADAKRRLAELIDASGRTQLVMAMLTDILKATEASGRRYVITADPDASELARKLEADLIIDPGLNLNEAIDYATDILVQFGVSELLVLPSDVPFVRAEDVGRIFEEPAEVVVAVSSDGGTNGLLRRPPAAIAAAFGPNSGESHLRLAEAKNLTAATVSLESLLLDIDDPADLARLRAGPESLASVRFARSLTNLE